MCTGNVAMQTLLTQIFEQQSEEEEQELPALLQGGEKRDVHMPFTQANSATLQQTELEEQTPPAVQASELPRFPTSSDFKGTDAPREIKVKATTIEVLKNFILLEGSG